MNDFSKKNAFSMDRVSQAGKDSEEIIIPLPPCDHTISMPLFEAISKRRSIRRFLPEPITIDHISRLLFSAQGVTDSRGLRAVPSAGALYPLELYVAVENVLSLNKGLYRYMPGKHVLSGIIHEGVRNGIGDAAWRQQPVLRAPVSFIITGIYFRVSGKYGEWGERFTHLEAGHAAQNLCLAATAMGLGTVVVGAFDDNKLRDFLGAGENETPLYIIPAGRI